MATFRLLRRYAHKGFPFRAYKKTIQLIGSDTYSTDDPRELKDLRRFVGSLLEEVAGAPQPAPEPVKAPEKAKVVVAPTPQPEEPSDDAEDDDDGEEFSDWPSWDVVKAMGWDEAREWLADVHDIKGTSWKELKTEYLAAKEAQG